MNKIHILITLYDFSTQNAKILLLMFNHDGYVHNMLHLAWFARNKIKREKFYVL